MTPAQRPPIYGILAEFENPQDVVGAARRARAEGYTKLDAYTPFTVEGLADALELGSTRVPLIVLIGGLVGAALGYGMQYYLMAVEYPLNIGGRPYHSWPSFVPITFEMTVLVAGLSAVLGMLALNRLPMPYHPIFNAPRFALATRDRFFLCIESGDPKFDREETRRFLDRMTPRVVSEVEW
jgi:hypothetical protein